MDFAVIKFGVVSESKPGYARVSFEEDNVVTDWLQVCHLFTLQNLAIHTLAIKQQVVCLMDKYITEGVVIGGLYNDADAPAATDVNKIQLKFKDNTIVEYDTNTHELKANVQGKATLTASVEADVTAPQIKLTGITTVTGNLNVIGLISAGGLALAAGYGGSTGNGKMTGDADIETTGTIKGGSVKQGAIELGTHKHVSASSGSPTSGPVP